MDGDKIIISPQEREIGRLSLCVLSSEICDEKSIYRKNIGWHPSSQVVKISDSDLECVKKVCRSCIIYRDSPKIFVYTHDPELIPTGKIELIVCERRRKGKRFVNLHYFLPRPTKPTQSSEREVGHITVNTLASEIVLENAAPPAQYLWLSPQDFQLVERLFPTCVTSNKNSTIFVYTTESKPIRPGPTKLIIVERNIEGQTYLKLHYHMAAHPVYTISGTNEDPGFMLHLTNADMWALLREHERYEAGNYDPEQLEIFGIVKPNPDIVVLTIDIGESHIFISFDSDRFASILQDIQKKLLEGSDNT